MSAIKIHCTELDSMIYQSGYFVAIKLIRFSHHIKANNHLVGHSSDINITHFIIFKGNSMELMTIFLLINFW